MIRNSVIYIYIFFLLYVILKNESYAVRKHILKEKTPQKLLPPKKMQQSRSSLSKASCVITRASGSKSESKINNSEKKKSESPRIRSFF